MSEYEKEHYCNNARCTAVPVSRKRKAAVLGKKGTVLSTFLIAILPKCPMCALAYSTAITMCSGTVYDHSADWTSFISIGLCVVTLALVLYNYKGGKTVLASTMIIVGGGFISYAELFSGNIKFYYVGCAIVLVGVWLNGSFEHFFRKAVSQGKRMISSLVQNA